MNNKSYQPNYKLVDKDENWLDQERIRRVVGFYKTIY